MTDEQEEEWRDIPGIPHYQASSQGNVRSVDREVYSLRGRWEQRKGVILSQCVVKGGYRSVKTKVGSRRVHRLVCAAFHGPPPEGKGQVRHKDGDPSNNAPNNLAWCDSSENTADQVAHGRHNNARKTHCKQGHAYTEDNIYWRNGKWRVCRKCTARWRERTGIKS